MLILGTAVSGALLANALVANAAAALKGPSRAAAAALLVAWMVAGTLAAWLYTRR